MAYLEPTFRFAYGPRRCLAGEVDVTSDVAGLDEAVNRFVSRRTPDRERVTRVNFRREVPDRLLREAAQRFPAARPDERGAGSFVIEVGTEIDVYADDDTGLFAGGATLVQMTEADPIVQRGMVYDRPVCGVRGLKLYLPAPEDIPYFLSVMDMLWFYRFNTVMIEVGGAMEYRRHPEINTGWVEYCREMSEYSGKTHIVQEHTCGWYKNSIHVENGGGRYLDQGAVRSIVDHCRRRGLEVIPEVPSLSHCDYLLTRHPEIAERSNDPYPDTYCPSNAASYELLFDVLDEIVDVFEPERLNIGHDEYYSIGICDRCAGRRAPEIFSEDVVRIHDHLAGRGVATLMWGEKLLSKGGSEVEMYQAWDRVNGAYQGTIPATKEAIDAVPRDVTMLHWFWKHAELELEYRDAGLSYIFGNFEGSMFPNWSGRIGNGALGAIISNWSSVREANLQRNGILFELVFAARLFWDAAYRDTDRRATMEAAFAELYRYGTVERLGGRALRPASSARATHLRVRHTTDRRFVYHLFVDGTFIIPSEFELGAYVIEYGDGSSARIPIVYGHSISCRSAEWDPRERSLAEVSYSTLPHLSGSTVWYETIYDNPHPDRAVRCVRIDIPEHATWTVDLRSVEFVSPAGG